MKIVILGLSLSSSWGNGHATTYRALIRGLHALKHDVLFLERDVPWYAGNRDLPSPGFCRLAFYDGVPDLDRFAGEIAGADAVIVGSYVPDGIAVIDRVLEWAPEQTAFYDIDTPVTLAALRRGEESFLARRQIPRFRCYHSFTGGPTLRRIEREFGAREAAALYCSVDDAAYAPGGETPDWDLGYLGTYSSDRQPTLERLLLAVARRLPHRRFVVGGPQYPAGIDWPDNVERLEHVAPAEHPRFYRRQRYTLNVTRADMIAAGWSPSVRLFEAAACGTPIVSDRWDGIEDVLPPGRAIRLADATEEVVAILEDPDDAARRAQADEARRRVLAHHTGRARAAQLAAHLSGARRHGAPGVMDPAKPPVVV
ncbi:MAG: glycosyltransferase [Gluconacetobacter diazotrophicus]|nr:glycosyltransferase [Gluconacetobacter diazotrophicus]